MPSRGHCGTVRSHVIVSAVTSRAVQLHELTVCLLQWQQMLCSNPLKGRLSLKFRGRAPAVVIYCPRAACQPTKTPLLTLWFKIPLSWTSVSQSRTKQRHNKFIQRQQGHQRSVSVTFLKIILIVSRDKQIKYFTIFTKHHEKRFALCFYFLCHFNIYLLVHLFIIYVFTHPSFQECAKFVYQLKIWIFVQ